MTQDGQDGGGINKLNVYRTENEKINFINK